MAARYSVGDQFTESNGYKVEIIQVGITEYELLVLVSPPTGNPVGTKYTRIHAILDSPKSKYAIVSKQVLTQGTIGTIANSSPKFKVGDIIQHNIIKPVKYQHRVDWVDILTKTYYCKIVWSSGVNTKKNVGDLWNDDFPTVDQEFDLAVGNVPNLQTTQPVKPKPLPDSFIGKTYKVTQGFSNHYASYKKDDIVVIESQSHTFGYLFKEINNLKGRGFVLEIIDFGKYLAEWTAPKCTCGLEKTWVQVHHRAPPKDKHDWYCDINKE